MNTLSDKIAVVTGGARGIGFAISKRLAAAGAKVAILSRNEDSCSNAAAAINEEYPGSSTHYAVDVADFDAVQSLAQQIIKELGDVNILVNNAGITKDKPLLLMKADDWDDVINVNLRGAFNATKAFQRSILKAKDPRIINISSVTGLLGNAGQLNYAASKSGLHGFTKSLAHELAARNVTCNAVAPGFIETDMTDVLNENIKEQILKKIPLKSFGNSQEVASLVYYLTTPEARYITGQVISIDGGMAM